MPTIVLFGGEDENAIRLATEQELQHYIMPNVNQPTRKLGKRAPRIDPRTFKLAKYLKPKELPRPPQSGGYQKRIKEWPMYLNDAIGDCVPAAMAHMIQQWTTYAGPQRLLTDQDVLMAYERIGGYLPGHPETDNGCDMLTALRVWRKEGIGGHKIVAFMQVNQRNFIEVASAIDLFGSTFCGFALPISTQTDAVWEVPHYGPVGDGSPGSWGGHCVPLVGFQFATGKAGTECVTWGSTAAVTWRYIQAYNDEMYAVVSKDWIMQNGQSPSGFDLDALLADLAAL